MVNQEQPMLIQVHLEQDWLILINSGNKPLVGNWAFPACVLIATVLPQVPQVIYLFHNLVVHLKSSQLNSDGSLPHVTAAFSSK